MKPLKLEFCGINSFSEHTIIDFEALTKGGLFGIFGDTGSGKSTVLDCINFALYGNVERSNGKLDIINYRSSAAKVKFVFDILNDGKRRRYTVERTLKKDKSGTHTAMLYEYDGEAERCIADKPTAVEKKIVEILGVEADDFRKCIALPQGEFAGFVQSPPRERLDLIERLFNLSRYGNGLKEKISARLNAAEGEFKLLTGKMTQYEGVSEELFNAAVAELDKERERLVGLKKARKAAAEKYDRLKSLFDKREELVSARLALEGLEKESERMGGLRRDLAALPKCREAAETAEEIAKRRAEIEKRISDAQKFSDDALRVSAELDGIEKELAATDFDGEIERLAKLSAAYETCAGKPEHLKTLNDGLAKKRAEYKGAETELSTLIQRRDRAQAAVNEAERAAETGGSERFEQLINIGLKGTFLRGEYAANLEYFAGLRGDIRVYEDDGPLYKFVSGELDGQIEIYKEKIEHLKDVGSADPASVLRDVKSAVEGREKLLSDLNLRRQELSAADADVRLKQTELKRIKDEGSDLRSRADEICAELKKVYGDRTDYAACTEKNSSDLERLRRRRKQLSELRQSLANTLAGLSGEVKKSEALTSSARVELEKLVLKLDAQVEQSGTGSAESCLALAEKYRSYPDAQKSLADYDKKVEAYSARIAALSLEEGIEGATRDALDGASSDLAQAERGELGAAEKIAVLSKECDDLKEKLQKKAELQKELDKCAADRDLIYQLKEVTKGNEFMKFIADEYLCDISSLASSTLLKLTDGRYFLTYKDNNFNVGDNFDCGNLRGVNTLSGGETFLVSLSLALALSQTICSGSRKSIEFFFLDEGFGTLDSTLIDTVITALEKLKSSDFIIGVISHVEELKQRIDSRITVFKATETHGSTVRISC